jgi:hypothetical protein
MIKADGKHVLFIEPRQAAAKEPVQDELSAKMHEAMSRARPTEGFYLGYHQCICGAKSDTRDWLLESGQKTNSLAVHYLEYHRHEVPEIELKKIRKL